MTTFQMDFEFCSRILMIVDAQTGRHTVPIPLHYVQVYVLISLDNVLRWYCICLTLCLVEATINVNQNITLRLDAIFFSFKMLFHPIHHQKRLKIFSISEVLEEVQWYARLCRGDMFYYPRLISWPAGWKHRSERFISMQTGGVSSAVGITQILPEGRGRWTLFHQQQLIRQSWHRPNYYR